MIEPPIRSRAPERLGIVADDFTGAADSAGVFAQQGWRVLLILAEGAASETAARPGTVLARVTGVRAAADADAERLSAAVVRRMIEDRVDQLYVKIDSTVRGSAGAQASGALAAWREHRPGARAIVCPAFPAQGRTVQAGMVLVDGVPVADAASGQDPVTPLARSDLASIFPAMAAERNSHRGTGEAVVFADARTDADLDRLAESVDADAVCVGSAGFAAALARRWSIGSPAFPGRTASGPVLTAVSSQHPVSREQVRVLRGDSGDHLVVLTASPDGTLTPEDAADRFADEVRAAIEMHQIGALILVGGDGAAAALAALEAIAVDIDGVLGEGYPTGIIVGGRADGLRLVTKSGGFGSPSTLAHLARALSPRDDLDITRSKEEHHD